MTGFVKVARLVDIPPGAAKRVRVGKELIAIFNLRGEFFALEDTCPHEGFSLSRGWLDDEQVVCPGHGWQFELATGRCANVPSARVATRRVKVEEDDILVEVDAASGPENDSA